MTNTSYCGTDGKAVKVLLVFSDKSLRWENVGQWDKMLHILYPPNVLQIMTAVNTLTPSRRQAIRNHHANLIVSIFTIIIIPHYSH